VLQILSVTRVHNRYAKLQFDKTVAAARSAAQGATDNKHCTDYLFLQEEPGEVWDDQSWSSCQLCSCCDSGYSTRMTLSST
jgi:hypothetical protein